MKQTVTVDKSLIRVSDISAVVVVGGSNILIILKNGKELNGKAMTLSEYKQDDELYASQTFFEYIKQRKIYVQEKMLDIEALINQGT